MGSPATAAYLPPTAGNAGLTKPAFYSPSIHDDFFLIASPPLKPLGRISDWRAVYQLILGTPTTESRGQAAGSYSSQCLHLGRTGKGRQRRAGVQHHGQWPAGARSYRFLHPWRLVTGPQLISAPCLQTQGTHLSPGDSSQCLCTLTPLPIRLHQIQNMIACRWF